MSAAIFNGTDFAVISGIARVFTFDSDTREFIAEIAEFIPHGVGLPANSCIDEPLPIKEGFVICRASDDSVWEYIEDHRGETVYSISDGAPSVIDYIGPIAEGYTSEEPIPSADAISAQVLAYNSSLRTQYAALAALNISILQAGIARDRMKLGDSDALISWDNYLCNLRDMTDADLQQSPAPFPEQPATIL